MARARAALDQARRDLAAHDLAAHLEKGEACPVCRRILESEPSLVMPPALSNAERDVENADKAHRASEKALREVERSGARMEEKFRAHREAAAAIQKELAEVATRKRLEASLKAVEEAESGLLKVSENTRAARKAEAKAHATLDRFADEEEQAWEAFEKARDRLATLGPPRTDREDLSEAWSKLSVWARDDSPGKRASAAEAQREAEGALAERKKVFDALAERGAELDVHVSTDRPRDGVVSELAAAEQEAKRVAETRKRAKTLERKLRSEREAASVAGALGQHLKSTGFERWLLEEAFRRLVSGATKILNELSSGQYSFEYDDKLNFEVVDHRNADERRSARTLSGGETFLASLALALTLADQTADLAAEALVFAGEPASEPQFGLVVAEQIPSGSNVVAGSSVELVLSFTGDCWTEVTDATGRRLYFDLGTEGRSATLNGVEPLDVLLGNSPNVSMRVNGFDYSIPAANRRGNIARLTIYGL